MIAIIFMQIHDYEPEVYVVDTDKLDETNPFFFQLKDRLSKEKKTTYMAFDGNDFEIEGQDFRIPRKSRAKLPCVVNRALIVQVLFEEFEPEEE